MIVDEVENHYSAMIFTMGDAGRFLVNVLIGACIIAVVGVDYIFIDYYEILVESKYFGGMLLLAIVLNIVVGYKVFGMLKAARR